MDSTVAAKLYSNWLSQHGHSPRTGPEGNVRFTNHGFEYVIIISTQDPEFFQLRVPEIWKCSDEDIQAAIFFTSTLNSRFEIIKFYQSNGWIVGAVEQLYTRPEDALPHLERILDMLSAAIIGFRSVMEGLAEKGGLDTYLTTKKAAKKYASADGDTFGLKWAHDHDDQHRDHYWLATASFTDNDLLIHFQTGPMLRYP